MSRLKFVTRTIRDEETDYVVDLAKAGMARKTIAEEAYGNPSIQCLDRVNTILSREDVRVTDYRKGNNSLGRSMIAAIRRQTDILGAIRSASKEKLDILKQKTA